MEANILYDLEAPKKPVNLTANTDLIQQAKSLGINLSSTFEKAVTDEIRLVKEKQWREESREGIEAYNRRISQYGVFGASLRKF